MPAFFGPAPTAAGQAIELAIAFTYAALCFERFFDVGDLAYAITPSHGRTAQGSGYQRAVTLLTADSPTCRPM